MIGVERSDPSVVWAGARAGEVSFGGTIDFGGIRSPRSKMIGVERPDLGVVWVGVGVGKVSFGGTFDSNSFVIIFFFFLFTGSREDSTSTSSVEDGASTAASLSGAGLLEEEAASFNFEAPEEVDFFVEEVTLPSAAIEDALTLRLGFFEANMYRRELPRGRQQRRRKREE